MTPQVSETIGCWTVGEFVDEPASNPTDVAGEPGNAGGGVGIRIVDEFVDHTPAGHAPTQDLSRLRPDLQASVAVMTLYDRAVTLYEDLVRREGRSNLASELARARSNKAIAIRELGEQRAAAALTDQAIALYERLVQQEGRHELANDLATIYDNKANTLCQLGDVQGTVALYDRAIAIRERLVHQEGRHELANDLTRTYQSKANALSLLGDGRAHRRD